MVNFTWCLFCNGRFSLMSVFFLYCLVVFFLYGVFFSRCNLFCSVYFILFLFVSAWSILLSASFHMAGFR